MSVELPQCPAEISNIKTGRESFAMNISEAQKLDWSGIGAGGLLDGDESNQSLRRRRQLTRGVRL